MATQAPKKQSNQSVQPFERVQQRYRFNLLPVWYRSSTRSIAIKALQLPMAVVTPDDGSCQMKIT
jgi:hypothetical protein